MTAPGVYVSGADSQLGHDLTVVVRDDGHHEMVASARDWTLLATLRPVPLSSVSALGGEALADTDPRPESRASARALLSGLPGQAER